jgi:penicillin-binding protein 1A
VKKVAPRGAQSGTRRSRVKRPERWRFWLRRAGVALLLLVVIGAIPPLRRVALAGTAKAILFVASPFAPDVVDLDQLPGGATLVAADGSPLGQLGAQGKRVAIKLAAVPDHVKNAVLAAEDEDFYSHEGIDASAIFRAILRTAQGRTQGGSTITQQLAKLNYTSGERTIVRKFREVQYVRALEKEYSKDELLERYLNQVYFGEGAYGIGAAAQQFFGVPTDQLNSAQAATLAGKIRSPEGLDPRNEAKAMVDRRNQVLANMREEDWITEPELAAAQAAPLELAPKGQGASAPARAPHFVAYVQREARALKELGPDEETREARLFTGGFRVETTLDPKVYDSTVEAVRANLGEPGDPITASASVEPGSGAIRSLFGGLDFAATQFDVSSLGLRQPGSAFKPFVYLAALRAGIDPRSTFNGTSGRVIPCYGDKPVQNYAGEDAGPRTDLDNALAHSVNVVFVDVGCQVGVDAVLSAATDDGVPEDATERQGAIFLGGLDRGVSALTMAAAYATFAGEGVYARPYAIARIVDRGGHVVYERGAEQRQAFSRDEVGVMNRATQQVVRSGTGRAAAIGRPVAGKTGTTQDNIDAWFVGYVPQLATAVWVGYEPRKPMTDVHGRAVTGGSFPARIFSALMRGALKGVPSKPLYVASPDALDLNPVEQSTTTGDTTTTVESSTTSSSSSTSTTFPEDTTVPDATTTSEPQGEPTTTEPFTTSTTKDKGNGNGGSDGDPGG